ncbi:MAG: matrix metalloproteinase-11 [Arthrobacter sp.]
MEPSEDDLVHLVAKGFICDTEGRGHETPGGRPPAEILVDATEGFVPLWQAGSILRWRFQERSFALASNPEKSKETVRKLMGDALLEWGAAAPVRFTYDPDLWDFEIVLQNAPKCSQTGCVLASAFFPDAGRHELVIYPTMFQQVRQEQVETLIHEFGHVFGLRHFFALVREEAWPAQVFGTHNKFTIMNYGPDSILTETDRNDLTKLYELARTGQLTNINGTPIRFVRPYSVSGQRVHEAALVVPVASGTDISQTAPATEY